MKNINLKPQLEYFKHIVNSFPKSFLLQFLPMKTIDRGLLFAIAGLTIFGLVMMSSMSIASSYEISQRNDFYFWRHFWHILAGIPIFWIALRFPLEKLRQLSVPIFLVGVILLILTFVIGTDFGTTAKLWLRIGGFSFQPVEMMKLAVIIFLAAIFSSGKLTPDSIEGGFLPFAVALSIPALLLIVQSDFGSLLVLTLTAAGMYFVAGAKVKHFFVGGAALAFCATIVTLTVPYIGRRVNVFLNPDLDPLNTGFQIKQAMIAIGSGGWFGRGFQNSIQKFNYLPEVQSDTIFAAISEELGFFRILFLIAVYGFIAWRGYEVALRTKNEFAKYLAVGITTWIVGQAFVNIAVNLALIPNTGITLPFISYGGSSMLMTLAGCGILLQISSLLPEKNQRRWYR